MALKNSQLIMQEHSIAKVELYGYYLSIYLNIIHRTSFIKRIYLYDLFAGEGMYLNDEIGSPIVAMNTIKNHYFSNQNSCPNIAVHFNEFGRSEIEPEINKIERIKGLVSKIFKPDNVALHFTNTEYNVLLPSIIKQLNHLDDSERALMFIDPWGYKEINPKDIKSLLQNGKTEIILFLPVSFMYRFANKAITDESYSGGKSLLKFLEELYGKGLPNTNSQVAFIEDLKNQFHHFTEVPYIDTFTIERENSNYFCLFFFSSNKRGFQKMLESKWKMDEDAGRGFSTKAKGDLFSEIESVDYKSMITDFLKENEGATNQKLFDFGLENGFLPKHTNEVIRLLKKEARLEIESLDSQPVMGNYIEDSHHRIVYFKLKN